MDSLTLIAKIGISVLVWAALIFGLYVTHLRTRAYFENRPNQEFRRQLIMLGLTLVAVLLGIIVVPATEALRGQLLSLYGIVISATIALSSTTIVGNAMAGIMLKTIRNFAPGDYVRVGEHFGRVSEIDLLHTEIQTEERDLTTLPNLYMVTHPVRVVRSTGTILVVEVGLGYDVPRHRIEKHLIAAAEQTGLESPYVQILKLGDYSVTYAIAGLLTDLNLILQKRRELRAQTMDALHEAGIEIVSPLTMSARVYPVDKTFIPEPAKPHETTETSSASPDELVFDKAAEAETLVKLKEQLEQSKTQLTELDAVLGAGGDERAIEVAKTTRAEVEQQITDLTAQIESREDKIEKI